MKTTPEFLDAVKAKYNLPSDYALQSVLGITKASISRLRNGKDYFGDTTAMRVAEVLGIDPGFVIACAHRERAKTAEEKAVWASMMEKLGGLAAMLILVPALLASPDARAASGLEMQIATSSNFQNLRK